MPPDAAKLAHPCPYYVSRRVQTRACKKSISIIFLTSDNQGTVKLSGINLISGANNKFALGFYRFTLRLYDHIDETMFKFILFIEKIFKNMKQKGKTG